MRIRLWIPAKFQTKFQMRILARIQMRVEGGDKGIERSRDRLAGLALASWPDGVFVVNSDSAAGCGWDGMGYNDRA
jgi:hypothetical protein